MSEQEAWQVFKWADEDPADPIDGRDPGSLVYVGRVVMPEDAPSYWSPDEDIIGERFGEGRFLVYDDDAILNWTVAGKYTRREPIFLNIVAETRYRARTEATF